MKKKNSLRDTPAVATSGQTPVSGPNIAGSFSPVLREDSILPTVPSPPISGSFSPPPKTQRSCQIWSAVLSVGCEMGCGWSKEVYLECLKKQLRMQKVPFTVRKEFHLSYKGEQLAETFQPDLVCFDEILVEVKTVEKLTNEDRAQVYSYLKATKLEFGLLINFSHTPKIEIDELPHVNRG